MVRETSPPKKKLAIFHPYPLNQVLMKDILEDSKNQFTILNLPLDYVRREGRDGQIKASIENFLVKENPHVTVIGVMPTDKAMVELIQSLKNQEEIKTKFLITTTAPEKLSHIDIPILAEPFHIDEFYNRVVELTNEIQDHPIKKEKEF
jgi:hypothetical protein